MSMAGHWHVASGLAGYGPDGSDGFGTATGWTQLANLLAEELDRAAEYLHEGAEGAADHDKAEAWDLNKEAFQASTMARNFDNGRADAPLYAGNPAAWHAAVEGLVAEHFPYYYDHTVGPDNSARLALYAWACEQGDDCEHATDEA